jgi:hypothetical protein
MWCELDLFVGAGRMPDRCADLEMVLGADIPHVATVKEDQLFRVETIDWTGGQIKDDDNSDDVKFVDLRLLRRITLFASALACESVY